MSEKLQTERISGWIGQLRIAMEAGHLSPSMQDLIDHLYKELMDRREAEWEPNQKPEGP